MTYRSPTSDLGFLYAMELFSGLSRGSYLVCIGWTTLIVTDDVARVGQVFIVAMLTGLLGGPLIGTLVDRHNRKVLVIAAHLGIAVTLGLLGTLWLGQSSPSVSALFIAVAVSTALRLTHNSSHDGLLQALVDKPDLIRTVARFRGLHLVATVLGTVLAGGIIERLSPQAGFLFSALCSLAVIVPMLFVKGGRIAKGARGVMAFLSDVNGGVRIFVTNRRVRLLALLAAVSLPVGQLSNAILSSFIRDDLGRGSEAFGIVDAAWPLGGMLAAGLLSFGHHRLAARNSEYLFAFLAGAATIGMAFSTSLPALVLFHAAMGLTVWLCRIVIDGRVLEVSAEENVGRTKVGIEMMFSLSALIMCLSPTLVALPSTAGYFLYWGVAMVGVSVLIWVRARV